MTGLGLMFEVLTFQFNSESIKNYKLLTFLYLAKIQRTIPFLVSKKLPNSKKFKKVNF